MNKLIIVLAVAFVIALVFLGIKTEQLRYAVTLTEENTIKVIDLPEEYSLASSDTLVCYQRNDTLFVSFDRYQIVKDSIAETAYYELMENMYQAWKRKKYLNYYTLTVLYAYNYPKNWEVDTAAHLKRGAIIMQFEDNISVKHYKINKTIIQRGLYPI